MAQKVAAITGASRGLGAALSLALAKKGYRLVLGSRNSIEIEEFTKDISKLTETVGVTVDVRKKDECERFIKASIDFGRLDLLVNNAGIWKMASIEDVEQEDIYAMFETNVFGPIYCSQSAVNIMRKQGSGHILSIGSTAAIDYKSSHIAYGASKSALIGFMGCLRTELQSTGIRVSVFSPGGMKTGLFRAYPERVREDFMQPSFVAEQIMKHIENPGDEWHVIFRRPR